MGEELMREVERFLLLQIIDQRWREHLYDMDYLREGIHLRGFAQIEPLVAYKNEAFELFRDLMNTIWGDFTQMIFHVEVTPVGPDGQPLPPPAPRGRSARRRAHHRRRPGQLLGRDGRSGRDGHGRRGSRGRRGGKWLLRGAIPPVEQRRVDESEQVGRNDPCWCGSGKKYKRCHGA